MCAIDLNSLGASADEVEAALAAERRPAVRQRLVAVAKVLDGKSIQHAAQAAKATRGSVERWLGQIQRSGFQSLLVDGRHGHAKQKMSPSETAQARRQIAAALARSPKPQLRARLVAIDAVLSGLPIEEAADTARVLPDAVRTWLRVVTRDGIDAAVEGWQTDRRLRPGSLDADPAILRELAATEINPRIRRRMLAVASIAEGMGLLDAAVSARLSHDTVLRSIKRFRAEGVAAFQDPKSNGRLRKLTPAQLEEIGKAVLTRPELSYGDVNDLIWTRFHVRYSRSSLRRLLKAELGLEWKPVRSNAAARNPPGGPRKPSKPELEELRDYVLKRPETSCARLQHLVWNRYRLCRSCASLKRLLKTEFGIEWTGASEKLAEGLNLAELQIALADTTDWRVKKKLRALVDLANGHDAGTVARANQMNLKTLRNWAKRYHTSQQR